MKQSFLNILMEIHGATTKPLVTLHAAGQVALQATDF